MLFAQILVMLAVVGLLTFGYVWINKNKKEELRKWSIALSSVLAIVVFFRYMLGNDILRTVYAFQNAPMQNKFFTVCGLIAIWLQYASVLALILYPFFTSKKYIMVIKNLCFLSSIFTFINFYPLTMNIVGNNAYTGFNIRTLLIGIELAISLMYSISLWVENGKFKIAKGDRKWLWFIVGMLVVTFPPYSLQALFGYGNPTLVLEDFTIEHRIALYASIILPIIIHFALRRRSDNTRRYALLYISLAAWLTFSLGFKFADFASPVEWPLHLCHTAMYIVPLCLLFKWDKIFYFTFFINVMGAFLAMAMPNTDSYILESSTYVFWVNHFAAFFMPILLITLRIYKRPKFKQITYSIVAFTVYFVTILIVNAWFSNYGEVDFFFVNSDFIADKLGLWAENMRNITWTFYIGDAKLVLYPLYQFLFWLVYVGFTFAMWFVYELGFNMMDSYAEMSLKRKLQKQSKIDLIKMLDGRSVGEPVDKENINKLVLKGFSKKYGSSHYYAVKDANLEVTGGQIFGFLGPNGAGKSTIIKSIVGIQPITDGTITVCGYDVDKQGVFAKSQIGFVPDHYALYEKLTGREYINYVADLYNVSLEDRNKRIDKYVKLFELESAFDNQMKTYSHGMKQKITIIAALVHNPRVWILDEPLTGLDPNSIFQVKECMKEHAKAGNIVFFSSHIIDVVERICDRIAIIKKGQIMCVEDVSKIEQNGTLENFYLSIIEQSANNEREKIEDEIVKSISTNKEKQNKTFDKKKERKQDKSKGEK